MRRDQMAGMRPDRPLRDADMRDLMRHGNAQLAHLLLARATHARCQTVGKSPGQDEPPAASEMNPRGPQNSPGEVTG